MPDRSDPWSISTLTPVERRDGRYFKRDDLFAPLGPDRVNGTKLRQLIVLAGDLVASGAEGLVTAASAHSPQIPMTAVVGARLGVPVHIVTGAKSVDHALRHSGPALAAEYGATIETTMPAYNPQLQRVGRAALDRRPGWAAVPYAISLPEPTTPDAARRFHEASADQARNLPDDMPALVLAFGSGNSAASVLWGMTRHNKRAARVVLVGVGPSRLAWLANRLTQLGCPHQLDLVSHIDLHAAKLVTYGERVAWTESGIPLHPNYEAKVGRFLASPRGQELVGEWTGDDACWWIVGSEPR